MTPPPGTIKPVPPFISVPPGVRETDILISGQVRWDLMASRDGPPPFSLTGVAPFAAGFPAGEQAVARHRRMPDDPWC